MVAIRFPAQQSLGSVGRTRPATEAMLALVSFGLCSVLCAALVLFAAGGEGIFPFHPIFFAVGFLMCTLSAINVMQTKLAPVAKLPRQTKGLIHGTLQFLGFVFMLMGFGAIYGSKEERNKPHLTTWHAWIGIAALAGMGLTLLGGMSNTVQISKMRLNYAWSDKLHRLSGRLSTSLGLVAVATGLWSHWATRNMGFVWQTTLTLITSVILAIVTIPLFAGKPVKKEQ